MAALQIQNVSRTFIQGDRNIRVLKGVSASVRPGEIVGLLGQSGAGKSTLLHITGLLEQADSGDIVIEGEACAGLGDADRTRIRREKLGFVYQFHHLLPEFDALENVILPLRIAGLDNKKAAERAETLLVRLGLKDRLDHRPSELSGGEQQRVAIARALANDPVILLADEPTGNLDEATAAKVFDELLSLVRDQGSAAIIATHNPGLATRMDRCLKLHDGLLSNN